MSVLLVDTNSLAVRNWCSIEIESDTENPNIKLWKYFVIDSLYRMLYKEQINEVVLAIDDSKSWRKLYWERYKESRKGKRDKSKINWNTFHAEYDKFMYEIKHYLPFKTLKVENAEADDVIGVLALSDNREYVVSSNDEDYLQLVSERVKYYNTQKQTFVKPEGTTEDFIVQLCLTGQAKDDIFSIAVPSDHPKGKRKPGFGEVSAKKVMAEGYEKWLEEKGDEYKDRFKRNRILIDFQLIPNVIKTRIMNAYKNYKMADPSKIYEFCKKNEFKGYIEDFTIFESKLLQLY
jgi:5'-3' exonuclease